MLDAREEADAEDGKNEEYQQEDSGNVYEGRQRKHQDPSDGVKALVVTNEAPKPRRPEKSHSSEPTEVSRQENVRHAKRNEQRVEAILQGSEVLGPADTTESEDDLNQEHVVARQVHLQSVGSRPDESQSQLQADLAAKDWD